MKKKIGYLGPEGTYTDQASYLYSQTDIRIPYGTIKEVTKSIENGDIDECILPIENSLHGTVIEVIDYLITSKKNLIKNELMLEINHCLIGKNIKDLSKIKVVKSKFEALQQCKKFIDNFLLMIDSNISPIIAESSIKIINKIKSILFVYVET